MKNEKIRSIDMTAKFSNFEVINKDFTRCRCNVMYTGRNRNYSDITDDALQKFIVRKGYANVPVVAHIMKDDEGNYYIGGHDRKLVISNEGIDLIDETVPYGVIPEDCNPSMDLITEKSGIKRKYFSVDVILWTHRYPIMKASYNDEIYFNQSMEISFDSYEYDNDGYVVVHDFSMSALCLLNKRDSSGTDGNNKNQEPCFESSCVKKFSINESTFKQNFELMLEKLKEYESDSATTALPVQDNAINNPTKGENKMDFVKIVESLSTVKCENNEKVCKYRLLNVTDSQVYVLDMENYQPYSFNYAIAKEEETENGYTVIDFDSKVEMSLSATEKINEENFEEFRIKDEIDIAINNFSKENEIINDKKIESLTNEISEKFQSEYDELRETYENLVNAYNIIQSKVDTYEKKENEAKIEAHKEEINSLVDSYADKLGKCSAFLVYKANIEQKYSMTKDQVEQDLILMAGKYLTSKENSLNKKFAYTPIESGVTHKTTTIGNKYGHLLDKYIK